MTLSLSRLRRLCGAWFLLVVVSSMPARADDKVLFADDFKGVQQTMPDGTHKLYVDPSKWGFTFWPGLKWPDSYGNGTNWLETNGEGQTYVSPFSATKIDGEIVPPKLRYDPFSIKSDGLHIKAQRLTPSQQAVYKVGGARRFGSGLLLSRFSFTYGHVRMVAKLPSARGSWPALWLLPEAHIWPPEIDIFEGMVWGKHAEQIHIGILTPKTENQNFLQWADLGVDSSQGFHEYGMDWSADKITLLFDSKEIYSGPTPPSMRQPMYVLINLAVGGKWPYNELGVKPVDSLDPIRLAAGADLIQGDYPAEMVVKSIAITAN